MMMYMEQLHDELVRLLGFLRPVPKDNTHPQDFYVPSIVNNTYILEVMLIKLGGYYYFVYAYALESQ